MIIVFGKLYGTSIHPLAAISMIHNMAQALYNF